MTAAAAGPPDPTAINRGYRTCARITRRSGTTYYWGALLLPPPDRRHVYAVYTLARLADDIVDAPGATQGAVTATAARLRAFEEKFFAALADPRAADSPELAAIVLSVRTAGIDEECFHRFFRAMEMDLTRDSYETWDDLCGYMEGSAAVIGEMMLPVLHPTSRAAFEPARSLGLAFQLTNFLRDIGEDLDRGRVYMPREDLRRFGADPSARRVDGPWREFMRFEIARNRDLYAHADEGLAHLPTASRKCVHTARVLYARILERIEAADFDVFSARARVPTAEKAALATRALALGGA
ncbi:MAG: phytoene/squalene synthase family protein [Actinomycetota bacterium]